MDSIFHHKLTYLQTSYIMQSDVIVVYYILTELQVLTWRIFFYLDWGFNFANNLLQASLEHEPWGSFEELALAILQVMQWASVLHRNAPYAYTARHWSDS